MIIFIIGVFLLATWVTLLAIAHFFDAQHIRSEINKQEVNDNEA